MQQERCLPNTPGPDDGHTLIVSEQAKRIGHRLSPAKKVLGLSNWTTMEIRIFDGHSYLLYEDYSRSDDFSRPRTTEVVTTLHSRRSGDFSRLRTTEVVTTLRS